MRAAKTMTVLLGLVVAGCGTGSAGKAAGPTATPTATPTSSPTEAGTTAPAPGSGLTPTPTVTTSKAPAAASAATLAFVLKGTVHVVHVSASGAKVGAQVDLGAFDAVSDLTWSPKGRYLAWYSTSSAGVSQLHIWDSKANHESVSALPEGTEAVRASGTGARTYANHTVRSFDRNGAAIGAFTVPEPDGQVKLGPDPQILELEPPVDTGNATLVLKTGATGGRPVGSVKPEPFLGTSTVPLLGSEALSPTGAYAVTTELGQDGGCAPRALLHQIPTTGTGTDHPVVLPKVGGQDTVRPVQLSFSPAGVLGGVFIQCREDGATPSVFAELTGGVWVTRATGVAIETRGPGGLLAKRGGGVTISDYEPVPAGTQQLVVYAGAVPTLSLGVASKAVWAP